MHESDLDKFVQEINQREKLIDLAQQLTDEVIQHNKEKS